ncbi:putative nuclease HARBI1 [Orchesella cincta]|uniref:Regulatory protein zeste n=1 Tax=Orchesella cincta TaxID=48709 RepID=A0A1D2MCZ6_ORCCI|nr:putative nuclease HARBI1 [Orchesella cincta]
MSVPLFVLQNERKRCYKQRKILESLSEFEIRKHCGLPWWGVREILPLFAELEGKISVIGAIDGTHVAIKAPVSNEVAFVNRKRFHSINVQVVVDDKFKFTDVLAKWPGSSHDSFIWNNSGVKRTLTTSLPSGWLIGDSGYPLETILLTPFPNSATDPIELAYNIAHTKTRCVVERTIGHWKSRFRSLCRIPLLEEDEDFFDQGLARELLNNLFLEATPLILLLKREDELQNKFTMANRSTNWLTCEESTLAQEGAKYFDTITGKFSPNLSKATKKEAWELITAKVNAVGGQSRSVDKVQKKWSNLRSSTKHIVAQNSRSITQTGGGPPQTIPLTNIQELVRLLFRSNVMRASEEGLIFMIQFGVKRRQSTKSGSCHAKPHVTSYRSNDYSNEILGTYTYLSAEQVDLVREQTSLMRTRNEYLSVLPSIAVSLERLSQQNFRPSSLNANPTTEIVEQDTQLMKSQFLLNLRLAKKTVWIAKVKFAEQVLNLSQKLCMPLLNAELLEKQASEHYESVLQAIPDVPAPELLPLPIERLYSQEFQRAVYRLGLILTTILNVAKSCTEYQASKSDYEAVLHFLSYFKSKGQHPIKFESQGMLTINGLFNTIAHFANISLRVYTFSYFLNTSVLLSLTWLVLVFAVNLILVDLFPQHLLEIHQNAPYGISTSPSYWTDRITDIFVNVSPATTTTSNSTNVTEYLDECPELNKWYGSNEFYSKLGAFLFPIFQSLDNAFSSYNDVFNVLHLVWLLFYVPDPNWDIVRVLAERAVLQGPRLRPVRELPCDRVVRLLLLNV